MPDSRFPGVTIGFYPRERFALAGRALSSIVRHTKVPFTLVIVDCGIPLRYRKEMESFLGGVPDVRWIKTDGFCTPMQSANLVVSSTQGDYVCLIENDNLVHDGWLERMVETAESMPADAVIPLIYEGPTWRREVHHDRGFARIELRNGEKGQSISVIGDSAELANRFREVAPKIVTTIEAHCVLYKRAALQAIGPFDEDLMVNGGVDTSFRLLTKGLTAAFDPRAVINHFPPTWIRADERPYYIWRWDYRRAGDSEKYFADRWPGTSFPDGLDFARGQMHRTDPFSYQLYRITRIPDRLRWIMKSDQFVRNSALFFVLSMTAAALSYLFHPVLARLLSVEDYGEVSALLSLYGTVAIPIGIFSTVVVNIVANTDEHDHHDVQARRRLISVLRKLATLVVGVVVAGALLAAPLLGRFFQFRNNWSLVAFAATFVMSASIFFRRAYLRGTKKFGALGISQIVETGIRLVLAAIFAFAGWRAVGTMFAVVLAQVCVFLFVREQTKSTFSFDRDVKLSLTPEVRRELRYARLILVNSLVAMAISVSDVLVIKHYFSPTEAGLYGGIATIARIVAYVTGAVTGVLVSSVRLKNTSAENGAVLRKAMILTAGLGGATLLAFVVAPSLAIKLLIGGRYLESAALLPKVSLMMFLVALVSPLFSYHLALRQPDAAVMGSAAVMLILVLCVMRHATPSAVVGDFIVGLSLLLAGLAAKAFLEKHKPHADVRA